MPMPKAAVDENDCIFTRENKVWAARKIAFVKPETQTKRVCGFPDANFWACVLGSYS
jgi:hypothetical protein